MRKARRVLVFVAVALALVVAMNAFGSMKYTVSAKAGNIIFDFKDDRSGKHTVWLVVIDRHTGQRREVTVVMDDGGGIWSPLGGEYNSWRQRPVPSGTYAYEVYDYGGHLREDRARFETSEHLAGSGMVTVR